MKILVLRKTPVLKP